MQLSSLMKNKIFLLFIYFCYLFALTDEQLERIKSKTNDVDLAPNFTLNAIKTTNYNNIKSYILSSFQDITNSDSVSFDDGDWSFEVKGDSIFSNLVDSDMQILYTKSNNEFAFLISSKEDLIEKEKVSLYDLKGKVVLINFWATWCGPCRMEIPDFNDLYRKYNDKDFEILGVSISDSERQLIDFKNGYNVLYPLLWGDQITTQNIQFQYGINSIPVSFLVNKNSEVIRIYPGAILKQYDVNMYTDLILNIEKALSD